MKWVILAETIVSIGFFVLGALSQHSARSADEAIGAMIPYSIGIVTIVLTFLTLIGWWGWMFTFRG